MIVRRGNVAPNISGRLFGAVSRPILGDDGKTSFFTFLDGSGPVTATVWKGDDQALSLIARGETQAPGTPSGTLFVSRFGFGMTPNKRGDLVLNASLTGPGVTVANGTGLWTDRDGPLSLLIRSGDPAPLNIPGAAVSINIGTSPTMNDQGQVAFYTDLAGVGITSANDSALILEDHGLTKVLAREADAAPGTPAGTMFSGFVPQFGLNNAGQIAFRADLSGPGVSTQNSSGLWAGTPDHLRLVARAGDPAPGMTGAAFGTFTSLPSQRAPLNDLGQVAFLAQLDGPGITAANDLSLWATDLNGALHLLAREGNAIETSPGQSRIVDQFLLLGGTSAESIILNNHGQVAFRARFADGDGIFVSNAVSVPEPATTGFVLALSILLPSSRRRRS
jgi:hypothetical protein